MFGGLGFGVLGLKVWELRFEVWGLGFRLEGVACREPDVGLGYRLA